MSAERAASTQWVELAACPACGSTTSRWVVLRTLDTSALRECDCDCHYGPGKALACRDEVPS